jgi:hypothetical protein
MSSIPIVTPQKQTARPSATCVGSFRHSIRHSLLPGVEGSIATIFLEISPSVLGPEKPPRELEGAARLVEGPGSLSPALMDGCRDRNRSSIANVPYCRIADALSDHADLDISVVNQPRLLRCVGIAAAGQGGHAP